MLGTKTKKKNDHLHLNTKLNELLYELDLFSVQVEKKIISVWSNIIADLFEFCCCCIFVCSWKQDKGEEIMDKFYICAVIKRNVHFMICYKTIEVFYNINDNLKYCILYEVKISMSFIISLVNIQYICKGQVLIE